MIRTELYLVTIPMNIAFSHSLATRKEAKNIFYAIDDGEITGVGECAPRPYVTGESVESVISTLQKININDIVSQIDFDSFDSAVKSIDEMNLSCSLAEQTFQPAAACALELALLDYLGKRFNMSLHGVGASLSGKNVSPENSDILLPISTVIDLSTTIESVLEGVERLYHIKIKADNDIQTDIARISKVRQYLGNEIPISIDVNCAWEYTEALRNFEKLKPFDIAWYEEPISPRSWGQMADLRKQAGQKIMLDESLCSFEDASTAITEGVCDYFNIRISKVGGLINAFNMISLAENYDIGYQIGVQVGEMGPLWAAGRKLAMANQSFAAYEAGQADRFFTDQVVTPPPVTNRINYLGKGLMGKGLGVTMNKNFTRYCQLISSNKALHH